MSQRPQSPAFKLYVLAVCTGWFAVPVAALWGLDWRWIPAAFVAAVALLLAGGIVAQQMHERADQRETERKRDGWSVSSDPWTTTLLDENEPR